MYSRPSPCRRLYTTKASLVNLLVQLNILLPVYNTERECSLLWTDSRMSRCVLKRFMCAIYNRIHMHFCIIIFCISMSGILWRHLYFCLRQGYVDSAPLFSQLTQLIPWNIFILFYFLLWNLHNGMSSFEIYSSSWVYISWCVFNVFVSCFKQL